MLRTLVSGNLLAWRTVMGAVNLPSSEVLGFQLFRSRIHRSSLPGENERRVLDLLDRHDEHCRRRGLLLGPLHRTRWNDAKERIAGPRVRPSELRLHDRNHFFSIMARWALRQGEVRGVKPLELRTQLALERFVAAVIGGPVAWVERKGQDNIWAMLEWSDNGVPRVTVYRTDLKLKLKDYEIERVLHEVAHVLLSHVPVNDDIAKLSRRSPTLVCNQTCDRDANELARELIVPAFQLAEDWLTVEHGVRRGVSAESLDAVANEVATRPRKEWGMKSWVERYGLSDPGTLRDSFFRKKLLYDEAQGSGETWFSHLIDKLRFRVKVPHLEIDNYGDDQQVD